MLTPKRSIKIMKKTFIIITIIATLLTLINASDSKKLKYKVKNDESISLICLKMYGKYSEEMGQKILSFNPSIKNINMIQTGQIILVPSPVSKTISKYKARIISIKQGVVTLVKNEAFLIRNGEKTKLTSNTLIYPADTIITKKEALVELIINRESISRIKSNSIVSIKKFKDPSIKKSCTVLNLTKGSVWTKVKKFTDKLNRFQLTLPTAVAGVYGTVYESTVQEDNSSEVKVFEGKVGIKKKLEKNVNPKSSEVFEVSGPEEIQGPTEVLLSEWVQIVKAMQKVSISEEGVLSPVFSFNIEKSDSWEEWNIKRDLQLNSLFGD